MKIEATEPTCGIEPGGHAPFDAPQIRLGRRHVLLARKQECHVDRNSRKDRLLDGRQTFFGAGDFDEQVGPSRPRVQVPWRRRWCWPCRAPVVATLPATPSRPRRWCGRESAEQIGGPREIIQRQIEKQCFAGFPLRQLLSNGGIVGSAVLDGVIEDRRVRGQPGHRELVNVAS